MVRYDSYSFELSEAQVDDVVKVLDANGDGNIDISELEDLRTTTVEMKQLMTRLNPVGAFARREPCRHSHAHPGAAQDSAPI